MLYIETEPTGGVICVFVPRGTNGSPVREPEAAARHQLHALAVCPLPCLHSFEAHRFLVPRAALCAAGRLGNVDSVYFLIFYFP